MKPEIDAGEHGCRRSPDIDAGAGIFAESGTLQGKLHEAEQAEDRLHGSGLGIPHNSCLYNKLEHIPHSRSEQGVGLHIARGKPQVGTGPGIEHRRFEIGMEPGTSPGWSGTDMEPGISPGKLEWGMVRGIPQFASQKGLEPLPASWHKWT